MRPKRHHALVGLSTAFLTVACATEPQTPVTEESPSPEPLAAVAGSHLAHRLQALAVAQEQLAEAQRRGNREGEGHLLVQIAYLHQDLDDHDRASRSFRRAQVLKRRLADVEGEVLALGGWIETLEVLEDDFASCRALRRLVQLLRTAGDPIVEARARLATTCARLDDFEEPQQLP